MIPEVTDVHQASFRRSEFSAKPELGAWSMSTEPDHKVDVGGVDDGQRVKREDQEDAPLYLDSRHKGMPTTYAAFLKMESRDEQKIPESKRYVCSRFNVLCVILIEYQHVHCRDDHESTMNILRCGAGWDRIERVDYQPTFSPNSRYVILYLCLLFL